MMETFSYPLFFQEGEPGWGEEAGDYDDKADRLLISAYIKSRILKVENLQAPALLDPTGKLYCNRFQLLARLGQVYFVDMISRLVDLKLEFITDHQSLIRGGTGEDFDRIGDTAEEKEAKRNSVYCPSSITGGKRHLKDLARNALIVVSELGPPTEFVTLTCNAKWREIQERLLEGQDAFDRPDICAQVFREKLKQFIANLSAGLYHGGCMRYVDGSEDGTYIPHQAADGEKALVYIMMVIEYQHRGLPHAHIVYRVYYAKEGPRRDDDEETTIRKKKEVIQWIDGYTHEHPLDNGQTAKDVYFGHVIAYRPGKPEEAMIDRTPSVEADIILDDVIGENQLHKCAVAENGCKKTADTPCKVSQ
jgi:hypothetical protein